ncbi:MAG TPA: transposase [Rhodanobacteraceae bacterium]|nr:transposase [Rhodanobacteraceae bacterium]
MHRHDKPGHVALRNGRISLNGQIYHVTTTSHDRVRVFGDFDTACAVARCFDNPRLLGDARMLAWVLMPDHVHWLVELAQGNLDSVVNRLKSSSAREANRWLHRDGALWARAYQDHALRREENVTAAARYIIANPVRAGLVRHAGDYPFWNAVWL